MTPILIWLIRIYQKIFSWFFPSPACRFSPSCSEFTICALQRYGFFVGLRKGLWRLVRCQGFSTGGYDPLK